MTGPTRSPSSVWGRDSQNCQPLGSPSQPSTLPKCDSYSSPTGDFFHSQNRGPDLSSPGYFGISSNHQFNLKQGFHTKDWDHFSHPQPSISSPKLHILPQKPYFGDYVDLPKDASDSDKEYRDFVAQGLPLRRQVQRPDNLPGANVSCPPFLKSPQSQHLVHPVRSHKMSVFWKENSSQCEQADEDVSPARFPETPTHPHSAPPRSSQTTGQTLTPYLTGIDPCAMPSTSVSQRIRDAPQSNLADRCGTIVSPERCAELLQSCRDEVMLLDVRPYAHFAQGNINGSLNLCVPTTLLKRRSFDTQKLESTFTNEVEKRNFAKWKNCRFIIVYDAMTTEMKDAAPLLNVLKKFIVEGWGGEGLILCGGFRAFSDMFPDLIRSGQPQGSSPSLNQSASLTVGAPLVAPVVGGCTLPESSTVAVPFFGNIRQNTDLIGGVGQIPPRLPEQLTESKRQMLPTWLRLASDPKDEGYQVSTKFLDLERRELERMKEALSYEKSAESSSTIARRFRIAGIEKGNKNRYNDIYPFDHSRVRLQDVATGGCDYVNANHIKAEYGNRRYIATQAPVPDTFNDFWRVVWEQDVRLLVSLTAEVERGQVKCHRYWETGDYGPFRVRNFAQRRIRLDSQSDTGNTGHLSGQQDVGDDPCIIVRYMSLSHSAFPFQPLREITQLQYPSWPDFGITSQPSHLLRLIGQCDEVSKAATDAVATNSEPGVEEQRPLLVHCSAGCGRTGTFCTVDSVLGMLKQKLQGPISKWPAEAWIHDETLDLIAKTVEDFRTQRPSMVQNLSQFVLCYESVLEWLMSQMREEEMSGTMQQGQDI
ncbi:phosphatase [Aspergillus sclerotialis]|uniref:protein-tyrosine-phosphatase n=1 Tax=Aspergillus sclerotialis TaxID=2070753 RepID=A0A3A2ZKA2_9EURO|nr:phosphatase [Aspergillus sclerotialis]